MGYKESCSGSGCPSDAARLPWPIITQLLLKFSLQIQWVSWIYHYRSVEHDCFHDLNHRKITKHFAEECNLTHTKFLQTNHVQFMPAGRRPATTVIQLTENSQWWQKMVCILETQTHVSNCPLVSPPDCLVSKTERRWPLTVPIPLRALDYVQKEGRFSLYALTVATLPFVYRSHFVVHFWVLGGIKSMQMVLLYSVVKYVPSYLWYATFSHWRSLLPVEVRVWYCHRHIDWYFKVISWHSC
jgi:hypothetical protein